MSSWHHMAQVLVLDKWEEAPDTKEADHSLRTLYSQLIEQ